MRCGRCGNDNSDTGRFCGMCGAPLVAKSASGQTAGAGLSGSVAPQRPNAAPGPAVAREGPRASNVGILGLDSAPPQRNQEPVPSRDAESSAGPVISGPSFLGLNVPAAGSRRELRRDHDNSSDDHPLRPSSQNLDYLLEEEEPRGGGSKLILLLIAIVLAGGFGYLHWKRGGFDWLTSGDKKPSAVVQPAPESGQNAAGAPSASETPAATTPGAPGPATPVTPPSGDVKPANAGDSAAANTTSAPPAQAAPSAAPAAAPPTAGESGAQANPKSSEPGSDAAASDSKPQSAPEKPPAAEQATPRKAVTAKPTPAKAYDPVVEAERYIYGRGGVRQDCDHGLRLLKTSADQSNPKAMISLGALYSTGSCTPRDLPTAYRWFALALHKQPDNQALQDDLQKLWGQMTQPERQLAIKLSQ